VVAEHLFDLSPVSFFHHGTLDFKGGGKLSGGDREFLGKQNKAADL
jgi:hypothetical protein